MRSVTLKFLILGLVGAAAIGASGCSSAPSNGAARAEPLGTVGMAVSLPGNLEIDTISYSITGPSTYTGTLDVQGDSVIQLGVTNVTAGSGYILSENATSVDGTVVCSGSSAPFAVSAGATTAVTVALACTTAPDAGAVVGTTVATECAKWTSALATPNETTVGGVVQVAAAATAPNPSAVTFTWSASAGAIDTPNASSANFTCPTTPGPVTITLTVGDGPIPDGGACPASDTTTTLTVTCDAAPAVDAGPPDTGAQAPVPCTAAGQTGCVACSGNANGVCSATEALLVQHDINAGAAATTPCYACLLNNGCIDDTLFGDKGNECDDLGSASTTCLATASCILQSSCASSSVSTCFCGSFSGTACISAPTPDGACYAQEVSGLGGLTSNQAILESFTNTTLPSGMANQLFQCALSNQCTACLQ